MAAITRLSVAQALASVDSGPSGLSSQEAARRLTDYGPNRVETTPRKPAILRLLLEFAQFFSIILWIAAALAFLAEWSSPGQGMARIGYAIVVVIVVSGIFSSGRSIATNERSQPCKICCQSRQGRCGTEGWSSCP